MISKYLPIEHETFEEMFHDIIKYDEKHPRKIISTSVPPDWKPPQEILKKIKSRLWINDELY